ncbi:MAG: efflux RND transporter permease subunit [Gammaproteobacteria bacterium]|nr:efflux RND transporter permease subunit [Gammaproteobacteria bacterium]
MANHEMRGGGIAAWSIHHPVGVVMMTLALVVLGGYAVQRLAVDLLPHIIYPEVRIRVLEPGVPALVMEDRITRQLEEQLAITEDAISVESTSTEGRSSVNLSFPYGKDIDIALRDASTRLDRAKRFLPDTVDPPVIYKRDPAQIPVLEYVISSAQMDAVALRSFADYRFSRWFINLPGVAAVEVGGGLVREIRIEPDLSRLASLGLGLEDLVAAIRSANQDIPIGRLITPQQELIGRTQGRLRSVEEIRQLPLSIDAGKVVYLHEVARIIDGNEDDRLRVRYNGETGVKISIQKQPAANTIDVAERVAERMQWLTEQKLLPEGMKISKVSDQAVYVRHSLSNASLAAISGGLLAMLIVYIFLGSIRRTLIIGSSIPIAIMITFMIMQAGGLTLNIMSLGGLALGVGLLLDNTIVMLENIYRHQQEGESPKQAGEHAAREIYSAIVASTSTNLAAVLPFLFISGLIGLLFRELIFTISAAILASLLVAISLVPALSAQVHDTSVSRIRAHLDRVVQKLYLFIATILKPLLESRFLSIVLIVVFILLLSFSSVYFVNGKQEFLPAMDDGRIQVSVSTDPSMALEQMDRIILRIEGALRKDVAVEGIYSLVGGRIFGRTETLSSNSSTLYVQLLPVSQRKISSKAWIARVKKRIDTLQMSGVKIRMRTQGIRGIRTSRGADEVSIRIQGAELDVLKQLADKVASILSATEGLRNVEHSAEEVKEELALLVDRERASRLGLSVQQVGERVRMALDGVYISDFLRGDQSIAIRARVNSNLLKDIPALQGLTIALRNAKPIYLSDVAKLELDASPTQIQRENQMRIVEISASLAEQTGLEQVATVVQRLQTELKLPAGYTLYDAGMLQELKSGRSDLQRLLALALFLVLVVMAVQYESLRNPLIILVSIPFSVIGVGLILQNMAMPISMPVWLGLIMLAGIVVNNAIVLLEYVELVKPESASIADALLEAVRLRLRPILMTTLTTIVGMLPLALALSEGSEILRPLAITIISGLGFSLLVSLILIPVIYHMVYAGGEKRLS